MTKRHLKNAQGIGILCLLGCILLTAAGCSGRRSEQHRAAGDTLRELNRLEEARAEYDKAIEANPENPMATLGLAHCSAEEGKLDEALTFFESVRSMDTSVEVAYAEPVRLLVADGRMDDALSLSGEFAETAPEKGGRMRGVILMKMGRTDEAITDLRALAEAYPASDEIKLDLGAALLKGKKAEEAEKIFSALVEGGSTASVAARLGLIDVYRVQGRNDELVSEFAALVEARPEDLETKLGYARTLLMAGQPEKAEIIAREILEKDPESGWANYIVGYRKAESGAFEEATAFLRQAARALPEDDDVKKLLAHAESGGSTPPSSDASSDSAPPRVARGTEVSTTWQGLWKQAALNRLLAGRAVHLAESGEAEAREALTLAALFTYRATLAQELAAELPETSKIRGFIEAFFAKDPPRLATYFDEWKVEAPNVLRENALGFSMVAGGSREKGLSVFLYCLETWPDNGVALFNIGQVFRRLRQPVAAAQNLQRLIAMYPENIDAHQMLYSALREGRSFEAARRSAEASYTLFPDEKWSHVNLCQAYLDTGEPSLALQWLGRASGQFSDDPELQTMMAQVLVRLGDCDEAAKALEGISTTAPVIIAARAQLVSICKILEGDWPGALETASRVGVENRDATLALIIAAGLFQGGDAEAARAALVPEGSGRPVTGNMGMVMYAALGAESVELAESERAWAAKLAADPAHFSAVAAVAALQVAGFSDVAWAYYQEHLAEKAPHAAQIQLAFRALDGADSLDDVPGLARTVAETLPDDPRVWLGLSRVLASREDKDGQEAALEKALEVGPRNRNVLFTHAVFKEENGQLEAAVADYRVLVDVAPDSGAAHNNLAYTLLLSGSNDEEALKHALIASEKMPRDPGVLHTLGLARVRAGEQELAIENLRHAVEIDPSNPTIMFDYGKLLVDMGDKEEGRKRIRYALAMNKNAGISFPQAAEAETALESLAQ
jgi:tetratricopeptide (TPR) repeat protein